MPDFESEKQRRLMFAAATNPEVAKRRGIPQSVAKEMTGLDSQTDYLSAVSKGDANMIKSHADKLRGKL